MGYIIISREPEHVEKGEIYVKDANYYTSNPNEAMVYETREEAEQNLDKYNREEILQTVRTL